MSETQNRIVDFLDQLVDTLIDFLDAPRYPHLKLHNKSHNRERLCQRIGRCFTQAAEHSVDAAETGYWIDMGFVYLSLLEELGNEDN